MKHETSFRGIVERADFGMRQHIIYVPQDVALEYSLRLRLRVAGTLNGVPFRLALLSREGGRARYLSIGTGLRREAKLREGDEADVRFSEDRHADKIDMPRELKIALQQDPTARRLFATLTPGAQRSVVYYVTTARTEDTRIRRATEMLRKLCRGELQVQQKRRTSK